MDGSLLIFILLIAFVVLLFVMKLLGVGKKEKFETYMNCCPDCKKAIQRIKRLKRDHLLNYLTFLIFNYKRYRCIECGWEGLRWNNKSEPGRI